MEFFIEVKQNCPICGAHVPAESGFGQPFCCPGCGARLRRPLHYLQREGYVALGAAISVGLVLGARGWWIPVVSLVLWFPCALAIGSITLRYFPPKLEPWDGRDTPDHPAT